MASIKIYPKSEIEIRICKSAVRFEPYLERALSLDGSRLLEAMRYSVLCGGKRIRPFLVIETAALLLGANNAENDLVYQAACAIEFVHCYSLIHDDLPAMDDDNLRRGQPTLHKAFDEATAILAGDALLTLAFETLAMPATDASKQLLLIKELAHASGMQGMVAGQMLDLAAEKKRLSVDEVVRLQRLKTGEMFAVSCEVGAILRSEERRVGKEC